MFFGASMGRLGADFRGLLVPVFEERVCSTATNQWTSATADFVATLRDVAGVFVRGPLRLCSSGSPSGRLPRRDSESPQRQSVRFICNPVFFQPL